MASVLKYGNVLMHLSPASASGNVSKVETPYWVSTIYQSVWTLAGPHYVEGVGVGVAGLLNWEYADYDLLDEDEQPTHTWLSGSSLSIQMSTFGK